MRQLLPGVAMISGTGQKRGKLFERRSVDRILGNPFYCGTVVWNGVEFEGNHEVRLSRERYEKRQKLITSRNARSRHGMSLPASTGYPVF